MSPEALRAWSEQLTDNHFAEPLKGRYRIEQVAREPWERSFDLVREEVFPGDAHLDLTAAWSAERRARFDELNALLGQPIEHNLILRDLEQGDRPVGWYHGAQDLRATYYMAITAIHPEYRGKGIYSAFLARLMSLVDQLGFREVLSRHQADNNPVMIAKLRAGFKIAAFEMAPNYGFLVHLRYNFSPGMRAVYAWRVDPRTGAEGLIRDGILKPSEKP